MHHVVAPGGLVRLLSVVATFSATLFAFAFIIVIVIAWKLPVKLAHSFMLISSSIYHH